MKQCPNCSGLELYDDTEQYCPYCHTLLVPYVRNNRRRNSEPEDTPAEPVRPRQRRENAGAAANQAEERFETRVGGRYRYHGRVVSISPSSRFMSGPEKWINAIFLGRPYQIGNPVYETNIRIEEISWTRMPDQARNLLLYGDPNEISIGDDVNVTAVRRGDRLIVQDLVVNDVGGSVRMHGMISAAAFRLLALVVVLLIMLLVGAIVSFFTSGGFWTLLEALVGVVMALVLKLAAILLPIVLLGIVAWLLLKGFH